MTLVKTSKILSKRTGAAPSEPSTAEPVQPPVRSRRPPAGGGDRLAERIAAATEELASGIAEASAAAEELRRSMEQIASGAEEAAGASQEQLAAMNTVVASLSESRVQAEASRRRTESVQIVLAETAVQITTSVRAIERNAERQTASIAIINELDRRARDIGDITRTVSRISDQTNLLALNAAIEAARAGDHGRGFAVVAEEVRALAETSEKSALEVGALADGIQGDVRGVVVAVKDAADAAIAEAKSGAGVIETLDAMRNDMERIARGSEETLNASIEAERAASEAQRSAEQVAGAAEEQASAASEAQLGIQQQAQSLEQGQVAAQALAVLAETLHAGRAEASAAEQIGATAEELSATIQELSSAASQIMAAVEQINRGSQQQAAATQQTSAALAQIEKSAGLSRGNANVATDRVTLMEAALRESRSLVEKLIEGVDGAREMTRTSLATISGIETIGRRIEKVIDAISLIIVQTNMLAVSGSVEAARAGDAGRGFAVVSGDIRTLAREASQSVEVAKDTVRSILDGAAGLRRDLEAAIAAAEIEVQSNRAIFATLERIDAEVNALGTNSRAILDGIETVLEAVVQTGAGARQIAAAAEEASAAARQAATASTQQARGAEDLAAAVEEIALLADELKQNG
jgi:methyl-accepting chemotaxis protein